ncbi:MAG: Lrp/AsnC family transcriptional regulator, partial [Candidatus Altarchaeum sp.]|nr:Lrp/AsnC family transcriptional regulator [Candidatus Altarchaeum sp.]
KSKVNKTIDNLKNKGIIMGFKSIINWKKINKEKISSILQIKVIPQEREGFAKFCKEISMDSRVKDVFVVTGDYDVHIYMEGENMDEISEFVTAKIATKKGVIGTNTHIVMKEFKRNGAKLFEEENKREIISI